MPRVRPPVSRGRVAAVAATLLTVLVGFAGPAVAHQGDPSVRVVLDAVQPVLPPGVTAEVAPGVVDAIVATNTTDVPLEVLGTHGELFLRITADEVLANLASPDWYTTNAPEGSAPLPPDVARDLGRGVPRLARVARSGSWSWFDHRLHPAAVTVPAAVRAAGRDALLGGWTVPLRYGGQPHTMRGSVRYAPTRGAFAVTVDPAPAGLTVSPLQGSLPGLFLSLAAGHELVVEGRDGQPFLRWTAGGVEANTAAASWLDVEQAQGTVPTVPVVAAPTVGDAPVWQEVATSRAYSWLDVRLRYPAALPPADVLAAATPREVQRWRIPLVLDGAPAVLAGSVRWVPTAVTEALVRPDRTHDGPRSGGRSRGPLLALLLAILALGTVLAASRRKRRGVPAETEPVPGRK